MEVYEVHTVHPEKGGTRHTDIREAIWQYVSDPDMKLRINIDGALIILDEVMTAEFQAVTLPIGGKK